MTKVVINMDLRPRRGDIARASKALGVTDTCVRLYLSGCQSALSRDKRDRIVIKNSTQKGN